MPRPAELIYVAGAQAGQRTPLMTNPVVGGRGAECDVRVAEECVSRKAFTLTLRRDGWIFENLTTRKMEVSGKSYKPGKELILETGDVICPGVETRLLFVSADDDAEAALGAYRAERAKKAPPAPEPEPSEAPAPSPREIVPMARASVLPEPSLAIGAEVAEKVSDQALRAAVQAKEKAAKRRKYLLAFGVYAAVMVGVLILVATLRNPRPVTGPAGAPATLTNDDVGNCIRQAYQDYRLSRGRETLSLDSGKAADCLKKARILWANRAAAHGNPYDAFRNFKLYMAYSGLHIPKDAKDVDDCDAAKSFLIEHIWKLVQNIKLAEDKGDWAEAKGELAKLGSLLKGCTEDDPEYPILRYVSEHTTFVTIAGQKKKGRGGW